MPRNLERIEASSLMDLNQPGVGEHERKDAKRAECRGICGRSLEPT